MPESYETVLETEQPIPAEVVEAPEPVVEPVVEPVAVELPEQMYEYQPTDEHGRSLGGKQVIKYRTQNELVQKLTDQNVLVVRKLRETTKKQRLGISETENIPDSAQRFDTQLEFKPRPLTADERVRLSRDLLDPERFGEAVDTLFEATVGAKGSVISQTLTDTKVEMLRMRAKLESEAFAQATPEYFPCRDNWEAMTNWMLRNDLTPSRENFSLAFKTMGDAGVLLQAPPPAPVVVEAAPAPVPLPIAAPAPVPVVPRIASGLTREHSSDVLVTPRSIGDDIIYEKPILDRQGKPTGQAVRYTGLKAIDMMPGDEFARRVRSDKAFNQKYEALLREQEQRQRA